jgi:hypothetical protein
MSKKSLIFGGIVLMCAMLFVLAACEGPVGPAGLDGTNGTAGTNGAPGTNGGDGPKGDNGLSGGVVLFSGDITDADLEAAFTTTETTVILGSGVTSVYGEVPANRTLRVVGNTAVADGQTLTLKGGLVLYSASAELHADVISSASGSLMVEGGAINGNGKLYLPVDTDGSADGNYATYQSVNFAHKEVGSFVASTSVTAIASAAPTDIAVIFGLEDGPEVLTVSGVITTLGTNFEVPEGKTLTLSGASTFGTGEFDVTVAGTLILGSAAVGFAPVGDVNVNGSLVLDTGSTITIAENKALALGASGTVSGTGVIIAKGDDSSEGIITISGVEYTTESGGVVGGDLADAAAAIVLSTVALTDSALIDLDDTFGTSGVTGIGSVTIDTQGSATAIQNTADGSLGATVEVGSGITLTGTTLADGSGTDTLTNTDFTLTIENNTDLSIADSAYDTNNGAKAGVLAVDGVQLKHSSLIGPELDTFHIGVSTSR